MNFSILECFNELRFNEAEKLLELWNNFPKENYSCEDFLIFIKKHEDEYESVLSILKEKLTSQSILFSSYLVDYYNYKKIIEVNSIKEKCKNWNGKLFYKRQIELLEKQICKNLNDLIGFYGELYSSLYNETCFLNSFDEEGYINYCIIKLLFDVYTDFNRIKNKFKSVDLKNNSLFEFYSNNDIDLSGDEQYNKYGLLSISLDNFEFCSNNPFQLRDKRCDSAFYFSNLIPNKTSLCINNHLSLIEFLWNCLVEGRINKLSLRPEFNDVPGSGQTISLEEFERGVPFDIKGLNVENVSKLFQENNYSNQLWVYMDGESDITFEEFDEYNTESYLEISGFVVTNVVHLKYFIENNDYFIEHIDHEYIFYLPGEYEKRKNNHLQKGNAKKRLKTFKIDDSKIPLSSQRDLEFLEVILKECLSHVDLIEEFLCNY